EDIGAFKLRYPFAFQAPAPVPVPPILLHERPTVAEEAQSFATQPVPSPLEAAPVTSLRAEPEPLPQDDAVPDEILEFFVPEVEEDLQVVTHCLLSLETNPGAEQIHRLLRAMHTVKGSAAQVGLRRISHVAHRAEDLIGKLRDGDLRPSAEIVDISLEAADVLNKFLSRQWAGEAEMQAAVQPLLARIARLAPTEKEETVELPRAASEPAAPAPQANTPEPAEVPVARVPEAKPPSVLELALEDTPVPFAGPSGMEPPAPATPVSKLETAVVTEAMKPAEAVKSIDGLDKAEEELLRKEPSSMPQSKSVRIALERLDRMMNAVGEL